MFARCRATERFRPAGAGFTLVEMLLVVAIIVLLIAMLLPALGRARYESMSTLCGTRKQQIGTGLTHYAMDFERWYPVRWTGAPRHNLPFWWSAGSADMHEVPEQYMGSGEGATPVALLCAVAPTGVWGRQIPWPLSNIYRTNISVYAGWKWDNSAASSCIPMLPYEQMAMRMGQAPTRPMAGPNIEDMTNDSVAGFSGWVITHASNPAYHNRSYTGPPEPSPDPIPFLLGDCSVIFTAELERVYRDPGWGMKYWAAP